jgi:hypothetical protein
MPALRRSLGLHPKGDRIEIAGIVVLVGSDFRLQAAFHARKSRIKGGTPN